MGASEQQLSNPSGQPSPESKPGEQLGPEGLSKPGEAAEQVVAPEMQRALAQERRGENKKKGGAKKKKGKKKRSRRLLLKAKAKKNTEKASNAKAKKNTEKASKAKDKKKIAQKESCDPATEDCKAKPKGKGKKPKDSAKASAKEDVGSPKKGRKLQEQTEEMKALVKTLGRLLGCPKCSWNERIGCKQCRNPKYKPRSQRPEA